MTLWVLHKARHECGCRKPNLRLTTNPKRCEADFVPSKVRQRRTLGPFKWLPQKYPHKLCGLTGGLQGNQFTVTQHCPFARPIDAGALLHRYRREFDGMGGSRGFPPRRFWGMVKIGREMPKTDFGAFLLVSLVKKEGYWFPFETTSNNGYRASIRQCGPAFSN